jgi:diguanylate cyclase (GGDEF)-like protein
LLTIQFTLSSRNETPLALAFIDLDHFKQINDSFGHEAGDVVLRDAAKGLQRRLRTGDMLVRWGGEEFLLILPNTNLENARGALERILSAGLGAHPGGGSVTASIGVAETDADAVTDWATLVEVADRRMYEAKRTGRNRIVATG